MRLKAIVTGRCPRCFQGKIFKPGLAGLFVMHDACDTCGLPFLREAGYFLGAIYISYGLGVFSVLPVAVFMALVLEWPLAVVLTLMSIQTVLGGVFFLRFSRIFWLHMDQVIDPSRWPDSRQTF